MGPAPLLRPTTAPTPNAQAHGAISTSENATLTDERTARDVLILFLILVSINYVRTI